MKPVASSKRPEKRAAIREVNDVVAGAEYCFILNYGGLTVAAFAALRGELRKAKSTVKVVKNAFLAKAAEAKGWKGIDALLAGPTAVVTGNGDPAEVAKVIIAFLKKNEKSSVKGAQLGSAALNPAEVKVLSELPSKDTMRATLLRTLLAPATSLVRVFTAPLTGVLYVLKAKVEKDGGEGSAA
jgi:large subunit ribosomal protein L10